MPKVKNAGEGSTQPYVTDRQRRKYKREVTKLLEEGKNAESKQYVEDGRLPAKEHDKCVTTYLLQQGKNGGISRRLNFGLFSEPSQHQVAVNPAGIASGVLFQFFGNDSRSSLGSDQGIPPAPAEFPGFNP